MRTIEQLLALPDEAEVTPAEGACLSGYWESARVNNRCILEDLAELRAQERTAGLTRQRQIRQEIESLHEALEAYGD